MNLTDNPTREEFRSLLSVLDDDASSHMAWVGHDGTVHIDPVEDPLSHARRNEDQMRFRLESFVRGNGYVGPKAAKDNAWVDRLFNGLVNLWEDRAVGYQDLY